MPYGVVGAIISLLAGAIPGNLDSQMRNFLSSASPVLIPFFAFAHGAEIDLKAVWHAGLLELPLGLSVVAVTVTVLLTTDPFTGGHGVAGMAWQVGEKCGPKELSADGGGLTAATKS